jgi:hypothetical protein
VNIFESKTKVSHYFLQAYTIVVATFEVKISEEMPFLLIIEVYFGMPTSYLKFQAKEL